MRTKRNDIEEESAAEREIAYTRIILGWALVLVILFWITSAPSSTESRAVQFSICGSLVGGGASTQSEGECAEDAEIVRASIAMPRMFDVARRMMGEAWANPKPLEMTATFVGGDAKARLTMQMGFVPAEPRAQYAQEYSGWDSGRL
jgi:hypothetical protein